MRFLPAAILLFGVSAACPATDDVLWLNFDRTGEQGFLCATTGATCRVEGGPIVHEGALFATPFSSVDLPALPALEGQEQLTVSAWIASAEPPTGYRTILFKGNRGGDGNQQIHFFLSLCEGRPEFKFMDSEGRWRGILRNGNQFIVPGRKSVPLAEIPAVRQRRWSHVAATFNQGRIAVFLDGELLLAGLGEPKRLVPNSYPLCIGKGQDLDGHTGYVFSGLIDDVRISNRALSAETIAAMVRRDRAGKPEEEIAIEAVLPPGYDPDFKTKLPSVEAYERNLPEPVDRKQVVASVDLNAGLPMLAVDGKPVFPMAMMPEPYASDDGITLSCRDFAAAGVDLYSEIFWSWMRPGQGCAGWWLGPGHYDFDTIDRRIRAILKANPRALIFPRLKLNPPEWWLKANPDEIARGADGARCEQVSLASEKWETAYDQMLRDVIRHMEASDYAGHIIGYHPAGGESSEWFWWGRAQTIDFSPAAVRRLQQWLRQRYHDDVSAFRLAWGDEKLAFDSAQPPSATFRRATEHMMFRHPRTARPVVDYEQFLSDMVSHNIDRSCRIVKEQTQGRKLAGVFYGYSSYCLDTVGFYGLGRALDSPHVDFLCSPTAYDRRRGGEPGVFVSAYTGSYRLHGKLYWDEVDTRTHLCTDFVPYRTATPEETVSTLQRACGHALTGGTGLWWFLLAGNATFHDAPTMEAIAAARRAAEASLAADRRPIHEVAVFADEPSMLYSTTNAPFRRALLRTTRDELATMGAPYDYYLLSDIAHPELPDYKLYIFLNAFKVEPSIRLAIDAKVKRDGKTAVWVYAPGYIGDNDFSEAGMESLTGMTLRAHDESLPGELRPADAPHPITAKLPNRRQWPWTVGPVFSVDDPEATVLGHTGPYDSLAVKRCDGWRSVYSMLPLTRELLHGLCREAGVHVYSESFDPCFANSGYAMIHTATAGEKRIALPGVFDVFDALSEKPLATAASAIEERLPQAATRIYRLVPHDSTKQ
ncbi:MAG: hypothetical protein GXY83_19570 [Rhodopirellula sp.]|nr:hypothetical protein [Rhodopirellula sp.]